MEKITACTLDCPDACSLVVSAGPTGEMVIRGNPEHPVTAGFVCSKIKSIARRLKHPDRIRHPLLNRNGGWVRIGWDEALDRCAHEIDRCREHPGSILHIQGDGAKGVVKEGVKSFFAAIGAGGTRGALCDGAGYEAFMRDFGSRENPNLEDLHHAQHIVNWGKDLNRTSVHLAAAIGRARRRGARVLTISPGAAGRETGAHVRIAPGSDRFLAAAAIQKLFLSGGVPDNIRACSADWGLFEERIRANSFSDLLGACGVSSADVDAVLACYREAGPTATLVGTGLQRYAFGGENVRYINALALASGQIGRSGGGVYYHLNSVKNFNLAWVEAARQAFPRSVALPTIGRDILNARDPKFEMAWINGTNIVNQAPAASRVARALEQVPFTVVVDAFMTDTAQRADVVLPCTLMLEQEDLVGSFLHDYVHYAPAVTAAPQEARDDLTIVRQLGRRLAPPIRVPDAEACIQAALESQFLDISLADLRACGFVRARRPDVPYAGLRFDHPDGRYRLPAWLHAPPPVDPQYPLRLMTLVRGDAMHSQIPPEKQAIPPRVWVAPGCPAVNHLDRNRPVVLESPLGRIEVRLKEMPGLHPEAVVYRRGDWMAVGGGANRLIEDRLTDMGEGAAYYDQKVRLVNG